MEFWAVQVMPAFVPSLLCCFYLQSYDSRPQDGIVPVNKVLVFIYQAFFGLLLVVKIRLRF